MKHNRKIIYLAGFLFSVPIALTSYVNSSFLENYISSYLVGLIYIIASVLTIWSMFKMPNILSFLGNRFTTLLFSTIAFLSLLMLSFGKTSSVAIISFILFFLSTNFVIASLDIFIEDFSKNGGVGKLRGIYLMIINSSWVIAQMISGSIITKSSFQGIYLFSAFFMFLVSIIFVVFLHDFKDPKYIKVPILKTMKVFIKNKSISKIYLINFILRFFFSWMVIYLPIYLYTYLGFDWKQIGLIFTIMLIPFVLLDVPLGRLSDKIGEKKLLIIGFSFISFFTFIIPFITVPSVLIFGLVLFGTRIGAATIEVMSESYFFKEIGEKNADEISFFRNTAPLSFIIGPILATPVLFLVPSFKYIFFALSIVLLIGLLISFRLKDIK
jgi:hypothetical protein